MLPYRKHRGRLGAIGLRWLRAGTWSCNGTNNTAFAVTTLRGTTGAIGLSLDPVSTQLSPVTGGGALIGAWYTGTSNDPAVLVFLQSGSNGTVYSSNFFLARYLPAGSPDGADEIEPGTYTWNSLPGAFTIGALIDQNSSAGLLASPLVTNFSVSGATLTRFDGSSLTLTSVTVVPGPLTYAAFAGLGALSLALWRRRSAA